VSFVKSCVSFGGSLVLCQSGFDSECDWSGQGFTSGIALAAKAKCNQQQEFNGFTAKPKRKPLRVHLQNCCST
jgi:hypothetical protein